MGHRTYASVFLVLISIMFKKAAENSIKCSSFNDSESHHDKRINETKPWLKNFKDDHQDGFQNCKLDFLLKLNLQNIYRHERVVCFIKQ